MLSFFPRDVLDEILNLIESVSEGFPSYSYMYFTDQNYNFFSIRQNKINSLFTGLFTLVSTITMPCILPRIALYSPGIHVIKSYGKLNGYTLT